MSLSGNIAISLLRLLKPGKGSFTDVEKSCKKAEIKNRKNEFVMPTDKKAKYELAENTECPCLIIRPRKRSVVSEEKAILFLYGGVTREWKAQIGIARGYANRTGLPVWFPIYPSVSEVNVKYSIDTLYHVYRKMTEQYDASKIAVVGVSFGGFFALELVNWNNRNHNPVPMPGLIIAHSPGGIPDNEQDWAELQKYEKRDPFFSTADLSVVRELTAHGEEVPGYAYTPTCEDFHNAPPAYLYYGEEMLAGNAVTYRRAFSRDGAADNLHITIEKNMMHCYSCMPIFPESKKAYFESINLISHL